MQTSTNNNHAFSAPRHKPEADRSWWIEPKAATDRAAFSEAVEDNLTRMQRSEMAKRVRGIIVGHLG